MSFWTSPVLELSGTLSHLSVSQSQHLQSPVILSLSVCLLNPEGPITILKRGSFLDPHHYGRDSCPFLLRSTRTSRLALFSILHVSYANHGNCYTIDADNDLLTLYHGVPITVDLTIGMNAGTTASTEESFLCTANIKQLHPGDTYSIEWHPTGRWTTVTHWWIRGSKESVVERYIPWWKYILGFRTFSTDASSSSLGHKGLRFQMLRYPEVLITK